MRRPEVLAYIIALLGCFIPIASTAQGGPLRRSDSSWLVDISAKLGTEFYEYLYDGRFYVCGVSPTKKGPTKFWNPYDDTIITLKDALHDGQACSKARPNLSIVIDAGVLPERGGDLPRPPVENGADFAAAVRGKGGYTAASFIRGAAIELVDEHVPKECWPAIRYHIRIRYADGSSDAFFLLEHLSKPKRYVVDPPGTAYEEVPCGSVGPGLSVSQFYEMPRLESLDLMDGTALWTVIDADGGQRHLYRVNGRIRSARIGKRLFVVTSADALGPLSENQWTALPAAKRYEMLIQATKAIAARG